MTVEHARRPLMPLADRSVLLSAPASPDPAPAALAPAVCLLAAPARRRLGAGRPHRGRGRRPRSPSRWSARSWWALWAAAGAFLGVRRRNDRLAPIVLAGAIAGGAGTLAAALARHDELDRRRRPRRRSRAATERRPAARHRDAPALRPGRRPPGHDRTAQRGRRRLRRGAPPPAWRCWPTVARLVAWPLVLLWVAGAGRSASTASHARYLAAGAVDRRRMQWFGWGTRGGRRGGDSWSSPCACWRAGPTSVPAVALALTGLRAHRPRAGDATPAWWPGSIASLTHTVALAGLTALVVGDLRGRGARASDARPPTTSVPSSCCRWRPPALAALLYLPARRWLTERANRLVYGERVAPDETLRTFGQRLTRADPDGRAAAAAGREPAQEHGARVGRGVDRPGRPLRAGRRGAPPPAAAPRRRRQGAAASWRGPASAAARGSTSGCRPSSGRMARRRCGSRRWPTPASCSASSSPRRRPDGEPFTEAEDRVLTELARQVGLALHNVQLDTALQASLDELRLRNEELQQSRARIVAAGDAERRKLERNLHDGAQQHLVALAVKLRLARRRRRRRSRRRQGDDRRDQGRRAGGHRRAALAGPRHLPAAARVGRPRRRAAGRGRAGRRCRPRSTPTAVGRYSAEMEAAVYFCVLGGAAERRQARRRRAVGPACGCGRDGASALRGGRRRGRLRRRRRRPGRATAS